MVTPFGWLSAEAAWFLKRREDVFQIVILKALEGIAAEVAALTAGIGNVQRVGGWEAGLVVVGTGHPPRFGVQKHLAALRKRLE